ncbi:hypothetical protein KBD87_01020 [Candidatus Saccharibacteria bacterium]|nr:hypothetical protein [Candidatus Saccharibacteria bacterium]
MKRFHAIIFFTLLGTLLITGVFIIASITKLPENQESSSTINPNFDTKTIQRVEEMNPDVLPQPAQGSRTNPFRE